MGCGGSKANVDAQLEAAAADESKNFKFLLLGAGEAGKSTFVKQAKFVFQDGISEGEKRLYNKSIKKNALDCMIQFGKSGRNLGIEEDSDEITSILNEIVPKEEDEDGYDSDAEELQLTPELGVKVKTLWESEFLKATFARRKEFWNLDASQYYFDNIERIAAADFDSTTQDVLMCRVLTTGVQVTQFPEGELVYSVVDVGGQRSERRKWIHCFDNVHAIFFLVSLVGYSQVLFEDGKTNRMHESISLFSDIVKNPLFKDTPVFILLNKADLFEQNIKTIDLNTCFPDYTNGPDYPAALDHVKMKYKEALREHCPDKDVVIQHLASTQGDELKDAFAVIKTHVHKHYNTPAKYIPNPQQ